MKKQQIIIIVFIFCNLLLGDSFVIDNRFTFNSMVSLQDTILDNQDDFIPNLPSNEGSFKSPGKALLYSGILPGMGQVYMKKWLRGLIFVALDGIAIGTWYHNNKLAAQKKREYANYANEHWDFGRWVRDYYKWYDYDDDNPDSEWNDIRKIFTNYSDTVFQCDTDITQSRCYIDIWSNSHSVEFTWDDDIISSNYIIDNHNVINSDEIDFKNVFDELCGPYSATFRVCENDSITIANKLSEHNVFVITDHHFYEGIQKYDMFFAGWDDNDSVEVVIKTHGDINVSSPNQRAYRKLWNDYNIIKRLAGNAGKFMLINRAVSMIDAVLLAKKWNNKHNVKLSLNAYPDLRNKSGLGGVKLSLHFR